MRTRVILFDDGQEPPRVVQSLDVPIEGRPDPGPGPAEGDIRVPGTTIRLRLAFLKNDRPEPISGDDARVYELAEGHVVAEVIISTDGQLARNAELEARVATLPMNDVLRLFAIAGTEAYARRMREVGTDLTEEQMVGYLVASLRDFQMARTSDG